MEELSEDVSLRIDDLLSKESDPFTTNDTMLDVMNSIRFNQFDAAIEEALNSVGDKVCLTSTTFLFHLNFTKWKWLGWGEYRLRITESWG